MRKSAIIACLLAPIFFGNQPVKCAEAVKRPNIVYILTDDQRWDAMGCMGDRIIQTPNMDKLAARGTLFKNHFVTTSICCVSRASIFSGQYQRRHGIGDFATPFTPKAWAQTYPALLKAAGYRTAFVGKFGVGKDVAPMAKEFDYWRGLPGQGGLFFEKSDPQHAHHITARMGDQALEFLKSTTPEQPFCIQISFTAPHARDGQPREFPPDLRDEKLYADATIPVPKTANEAMFKALPEFAQETEGHRRWKARFATPEMYQSTVKDYYRLISGIDREVGRIVDQLAELKLSDNTLVIFESDNGFFFGERGMADKWLMYEESIRVPLIIFDPRMKGWWRSRECKALTLNIDIAPTILQIAGVPIPDGPAGMQGKSMQLFIHSPLVPWRTDFFYEHNTLPKIIPPSEGVRTDDWAYLRWTGAEPAVEELYDLKNDPLEEHDLSKVAAQKEKLEALRKRWAVLREELK